MIEKESNKSMNRTQGMKTLYKKTAQNLPFALGERLVSNVHAVHSFHGAVCYGEIATGTTWVQSSYKSDAKQAGWPKIDRWRELCRLDKTVAEARCIREGN